MFSATSIKHLMRYKIFLPGNARSIGGSTTAAVELVLVLLALGELLLLLEVLDRLLELLLLELLLASGSRATMNSPSHRPAWGRSS
jgi:hypothetical protein